MFTIDLTTPQSVYFIGIGGISMSGLAKILLNAGYRVSGSDRDRSDAVLDLISCGIHVNIGHLASNISKELDLLVYTAAIRQDNPELLRAKELGITCITRAELLGGIMDNYNRSITVAGTHGKTTTTSMLSLILLEYSDPTVTIGGILPSIHSNVHIGSSDLFVAEACEYTNSFYSFFPRYSIILNIEEDHPDFFKDYADIRHSFRTFASNVKEGGALFLHGEIDNIEEFKAGLDCEVFTFGLSDKFDIYAENIKTYDGGSAFTPVVFGKSLCEMRLNVPGIFNIENALGVIGVCMKLTVPEDAVRTGLSHFRGTHRRLEFKGHYNGAEIFDDYAHHPTEIRASISALREHGAKRLCVLFQPHTYSRTEAYFDDFVDALSLADRVFLAEIYSAREENVNNLSSKSIVDSLVSKGCEAVYFSAFDEAIKFFQKNLMNEDLLITMGAGDIYLVADALLKE